MCVKVKSRNKLPLPADSHDHCVAFENKFSLHTFVYVALWNEKPMNSDKAEMMQKDNMHA